MATRALIDTAIVFTTRMELLADFYRRGLEPGEPQPSPGHLGFQVGQVYLGFDQVEEARSTPGAASLWFRVEDLQAVFDRFVALGAPFGYEPVEKPWGDGLASVFDLDGNLIGLSQRRRRAG